MAVESMPDLRAIIDPLIGAPYEQWDCWRLIRHLYREGWGIALEDDPGVAHREVQEIWFAGDTEEPLALVQPWDVVIMRTRGLASSHVGIVLDTQYFIHTRQRIGVCLEPLRRWQSRLLQIARLRRLC